MLAQILKEYTRQVFMKMITKTLNNTLYVVSSCYVLFIWVNKLQGFVYKDILYAICFRNVKLSE